jgi:hypothetical protein
MSDPPSRRNKYSQEYVSQGNVDYNIMAPLYFDGSTFPFPCKGFPKGPSTKTINGNKVSVTLEGSATHGGGHCQFGVTYDDSKFVVLRTVTDNCLTGGMTYDFDLPSNIPSGDITVFWTWINRIGNREYYMECADVTINNSNGGNSPVEISGKELLVVNILGNPVIPEGLPPGNDGTDLLNARKDISVISGSGSGSGNGGGSSQPPSQPPPSQPPPSQPLPSQPLPSQPLPSQPLPSQPLPSQPLPSQPPQGSSAATFYFRVGPDQPGCPTVQTFNDGNIYGPCNAKYGESSKYWAAISGGGQHCGEQITVSYGDRDIVLTVMDECPACAVDNHVDMSLDALVELTGSVNAACAINTLQPQVTWRFGGSSQSPPSPPSPPRQLPPQPSRVVSGITRPRYRKTRTQNIPVKTNTQKSIPTTKREFDDFDDYDEFMEYLEFRKYQEQYEKDCEQNV